MAEGYCPSVDDADWLRERLQSVADEPFMEKPNGYYDFTIDLSDAKWGAAPRDEFGGLTIAEHRADFLRIVKESQDDPTTMSFPTFAVFNRS